MKNILLFGGSGKLGAELCKYSNVIAPPRKECNITNYKQVDEMFRRVDAEVVINAAAIVGSKECDNSSNLAWSVNVVGVHNLVRASRLFNKRFIQISTNAIFDGKKGLYIEADTPSPTFFYAITKLSAEQIVLTLTDFAIIRLDFFSLNGFKYDKVFVDHFTSKIKANIAAHKILRIANSQFVGIINIGQERRSLFDIMREYYRGIIPIKISESLLPNYPKDLSLDLTKWNDIFG